MSEAQNGIGSFGRGGRIRDNSERQAEPESIGDHTLEETSPMVTCQDLAASIERLHPNAAPRDVARLCLLVSNLTADLDTLANENELVEAWLQTGLRLQSTSDQHSAMTDELAALADTAPEAYTPEQIETLLRAIKVQSQVLQLYLGDTVDV